VADRWPRASTLRERSRVARSRPDIAASISLGVQIASSLVAGGSALSCGYGIGSPLDSLLVQNPAWQLTREV
jgi:hypothetical protein